MARAGDVVADPISGAHVLFRETADEWLQLELRAAPRWSAGPVHVHPKQEERIEVIAGTLASQLGGREKTCRPGEVVRVPAGAPHTIWNAGDSELVLLVEFRPALRMAEAFETAIGLGRTRRTATPLRELVRVFLDTRGYRDEFRLVLPYWVSDGIVAGAIAAFVSGVPSTAHALASGRNPLESSLAAGSLVVPGEDRPHRLVIAAVPVHLALSVGWGFPLAALLPRRHTILVGAAAGLAIAALDLGFVGRRFRRVRELPLLPQLADHVAYGAVVAGIVARRRGRRASAAAIEIDPHG
jgi:mannose-6-phosphate isomerase-like protein (cupin superfamily)